jgi:hypothetical protein
VNAVLKDMFVNAIRKDMSVNATRRKILPYLKYDLYSKLVYLLLFYIVAPLPFGYPRGIAIGTIKHYFLHVMSNSLLGLACSGPLQSKTF